MLGRWRRWTTEQFAFLIVLAGLTVTFLYLLLEPGHWRRGSAAFAVVVLAAGVLRLVLPTLRVGFLAVRGRAADTAVYLVLGGLILAVDIRLHT